MRWYLLATNALVRSGRQSGGIFWPPANWYYVPANSHQATTPVLKRVRALRLGLVNISLRLNERKRCGEFGLVFLRFVGEEHTNNEFCLPNLAKFTELGQKLNVDSYKPRMTAQPRRLQAVRQMVTADASSTVEIPRDRLRDSCQ